MSNEADEIVSAIIAKWCAGFARLDAAALSSLYSTNAFFFGSKLADTGQYMHIVHIRQCGISEELRP